MAQVLNKTLPEVNRDPIQKPVCHHVSEFLEISEEWLYS